MPVPYELPFKQRLKNFIAQVIDHYKNNPNIGYIRLGLAIGGDFFPRCSTVMPGYSDLVWTNYALEMNTFEASLKPTMQLMQSVTQINSANDGNADIEADNAVKNGIAIGVQGWEKSDNNAKTCTSDWCSLFSKYSGKIGPLELQTLAVSDPTGVTQTGSLVDLIPFAISHHAEILELYTLDWLLALDPNYYKLNGATQEYGSYSTAYLKAITNGASTSGISDIKNNLNGYTLFPVPAHDNINISTRNEGTNLVKVCNLLGQLVYHTEFVTKQISINTSTWNPGFYNVSVKEDKDANFFTFKFVKK